MSFVYSFVPSESFYARPFGLTVNIYYRNVVCYCIIVVWSTRELIIIVWLIQEGDFFVDAVFNETINIVEMEEGLDGET